MSIWEYLLRILGPSSTEWRKRKANVVYTRNGMRAKDATSVEKQRADFAKEIRRSSSKARCITIFLWMEIPWL